MRHLAKHGYTSHYERVETAEAMRSALKEKPWDIVISDYKLPRFSGLDALAIFQETGIDIPFIIVSGTIGEDVAIEALKTGADDYVIKDRLGRIGSAVERALEERRLLREHKAAEKALSDSEERYRNIFDNAVEGIFQSTPGGRLLRANPAYARIFGYDSPQEMVDTVVDIGHQLYVDPEDRKRNLEAMEREGILKEFECRCRRKDGTEVWISINSRLSKTPEGTLCIEGFVQEITERKRAEVAIRESLSRLRRITGSIIDVIVMAVESRDPYTAGHQKRVADLARAIAAELGMPPAQAEGIRIAGVIHDLGKMSIPAEILTTPRKLSDIEYSLVKTHPSTGRDILKDVDFDWPVAEMVHQHHERMDGSGYPRGLKGDEIMPEARILAVADVVEAIASHRPYRPALGIEAALNEVASRRGILYDTPAVDACLKLFRERGYTFDQAGGRG